MPYINASHKVTEEVKHILAALPGKVFYAEDGEVLILADDGRHIISVTPNNTEFNNGNPVMSSAYLVNAPAEQLADGYAYSEAESVKGWQRLDFGMGLHPETNVQFRCPPGNPAWRTVINRFDNGLPVEPFKFEIEVPEHGGSA